MPMDVTESPMVAEVRPVAPEKACCARNSAGQPTASLDEWGGGREERTLPMAVTELPMVAEVTPVDEKAYCAQNSTGQPTDSLDEWGGGGERSVRRRWTRPSREW